MIEFGQAELYFKQAVFIRKEQTDYYGQMAVEIDLVNTYFRKGNYTRSLKYFEELCGRLNPDSLRLKSHALERISKTYLFMNDIQKAESRAIEALDLAKEVNARFNEKNILSILSQIYATSLDYQKALEFQKRYSDLNIWLSASKIFGRFNNLKIRIILKSKRPRIWF